MSREPRAFPRPTDAADARGSYGMTLRDYYAGRAMQALIGEMASSVATEGGDHLALAIHRTARISFLIADQMMKARDA